MNFSKTLKILSCFYLPALIFFLNWFVIVPFGIYSRWGWFDIPMHILGGAAIAYSFILLLRELDDKIVIQNRFMEILIILGLLSFIAIFWEFYEYLRHIMINVEQNTLDDTLADFLFGLSSGWVITTWIRIKNKWIKIKTKDKI